jgi:hypothetical protein
MNLYRELVELFGRGISQSQGRHLQRKRRHTFTPRVGFEPKVPVFERLKTFRGLNRTATVTCIAGNIAANFNLLVQESRIFLSSDNDNIRQNISVVWLTIKLRLREVPLLILISGAGYPLLQF